MTYVLRFLPIVEENILAGYTWYEEKTHGLGGEFLPVLCRRQRNSTESIAVPKLEQGSI